VNHSQICRIESREGGMDTKFPEVRNIFRLSEFRRVVCVLSVSIGMVSVGIPVLSQGQCGPHLVNSHGSKRRL
jgi:hypothetical protein